MGKPKNKAKDTDVDSDVDIAESEATEAKPVGKQSKKDKKKKKKDDDWEDDVANELQSLSLEANKGRKEENSVEEERAPVKKKEKEQQKKQALKKDGKVDEPKSEEKTEDQGAAAEEKVASGDDEAKEEEDDGKKKKKKKKGEKEEKPKKCKAPVAAIKELLKRQKEEEERLRQEEEERIRKEEEAIAAAIEKKRLEEEKKKLKKQKEKERKERLKAEGKLLTAQQKQEKLRQQQMLESMKAQGLEIKTKEEEVVEAKKKRPIYEKKKKKPQQKQDAGFGANTSTGGNRVFGQPTAQESTGGGMFGQPTAQASTRGGLFGQPSAQASTRGGLFGQPSAQASTRGGHEKIQPSFGTTTTTQPTTGTTTSGQSTATETGFGGFQTSPTCTREESGLNIPSKNDLQTLMNVLGINWILLYLTIATDNNSKKIEVSEKEAMRHVITHFAAAREKQKGNERSPFDFTLRDLVSRLNNLVDIHWLCVVNSLLNEKLKEKEDDVYKVMSSIFKKFQDFDTFWSALSMPHNDCEDDRFLEKDPFSNELKKLRDYINKINVSELPETLKEDKKFSFFLENQYLVSYAKSLNFKQYCCKFLMLCKINVDIDKWERYINKIGITAVRRKKSVDYFCVKYMYYLDKKYLVGRKVRSENDGEGTLGYAFCKDKNIYHIISLHILVDETTFKKMNTSLNQVVDIENPCKIDGILNAVIRKGVYSKGDRQSAGVEIVLVDTSSVLHVPSNSSSDHTVPIPPRQTKSKGSVHPQFDQSVGATGSGLPQFDTPVTSATGSDLPQFDTIKMGSTRPASFDTDSKIEGKYLDTPVIDDSILPPIGHQWKCHDLPDHLYFKGNKMLGNVIDSEVHVYILGAFTGLAKGNIQTGCTFEFYNHSGDKNKTFLNKFGKTLKELFTLSEPQKVSLENQYKVEWDPLGIPFSKEGDSGAPVFQVNKETGELTAVGILTGNNATLKVSYVTPIKDILHILQANGLNYELGHFELRHREQDKDVQQKLFSDLCRELGMV